MLKVDYEVKVWVGGTDDIPSIGLSGGVCTWNREIGILDDKWWGNISSKVDVSSGGNYETYSPTSINIVRSKIVEKTLNNYGLSLTGKRLEIHEITTGTRILYRGIIDKMMSDGENSMKISVSHVVNKYNSFLTNKVGKEYTYLVYGQDVDGVPLVVDSTTGTTEIGAIGAGEHYPAFENYTTFLDLATNFKIRSIYETTDVSISDIREFFDKSVSYIASGSNSYAVTYRETYEVSGGIESLFTVEPMVFKKGGVFAIPYGDIVTMKYTTPNAIYYPYGSVLDQNEIYIEGGGKLPFYIDSVKYLSDRIEILDADGAGFTYSEPSRTRWANKNEMQDFYNPFIIFGADGVAFSSESTGVIDSYNATSSDGDNIGYRGEGTVATAYGLQRGRAYDFDNQAFFNTHFLASYDIADPSIYDDMYISLEGILNGVTGWIVGDIIAVVKVKTIRTTHDIYENRFNDVIQSDNSRHRVDDFILPQEVAVDNENSRFRIFNSALTGNLWDSLKITLDEVEKNNPITIYYGITTTHQTGLETAIDRTVSVESMKINVFSEEPFSVGDIYADNVNGKTGVDTIADMYIDACSRQNLSTLGFAPPAIGWGLDIPSGDITTAVNVADITANAPSTQLKYKTDVTGTKTVKYDLLKYGFGIGFIDKDGLESWASILSMYDDDGVNITAYDVVGDPTVTGFNSNRVYTDIGITTHEGNFTIRNTEQLATDYSGDYVDGFDSATGKELWLLGNILYKKHGVKNEYIKTLSDVDAIIDEVEYIKNQYAVAGAVTVGDSTVLYDRYTLSISLSTEFVIANDLWKGKKIVFSFPHIASLHTGVITGFSKSITDEVYSITAEMVGGVLESTEVLQIIESGSQADNIIESGSQTDNYIEAV